MEIFLYSISLSVLLTSAMQEGLIILVVGVITVFLALISLFIVFKFLIPLILNRIQTKSPKSSGERTYDTGEEIAAVSAAIHLFLSEIHDEENTILTIHRLKKEYSPWSSKIYGTHHVRKR